MLYHIYKIDFTNHISIKRNYDDTFVLGESKFLYKIPPLDKDIQYQCGTFSWFAYPTMARKLFDKGSAVENQELYVEIRFNCYMKQ